MRVLAYLALCLLPLVSCVQQSEWTPSSPNNSPAHHHSPFRGWLKPLELHFMDSDVVARVRLAGVEEHISTVNAESYVEWRLASIEQPLGNTVYVPVLHYRFEVLEYLRGGSGSDTVWGYAILRGADSESKEDAGAAFSYYREHRDERWDEKEAVVFLYGPRVHEPDWIYAPDDHYQLGWIDVEPGFYETYSLQGNGGWFPAASNGSAWASSVLQSGGFSGQNREHSFLLREGSGGVDSEVQGKTEGAGASKVDTAVGLSELRRLAALSNEELEAELLEEGRRTFLSRLGDMKLTASASDNSITLRWIKDSYVAPGVVTYQILRRAQGEDIFVHLADIAPIGDPSRDLGNLPYEYVDNNGLEPDTTYLYVVRAAVEKLNIDKVDATVEVVTSPR